MEQPLISVVIPAYNAERFLKRSVASVAAQSWSNIETVIVDDGSTDDTLALARRLAVNDSRVKVVTQPNAGAAEARHRGVVESTGEYIMFLDADDEMAPEAAEQMWRRMSDNDLDFCVAVRYVQFGNNNGLTPSFFRCPGIVDGERFLERLMQPWGNVAIGCSIARREVWQDDAFPPGDLVMPMEDHLLAIGASQHINRVGIFNDIKQGNYYVNTQSLTATGRFHTTERWRQHFDYLRRLLDRRGLLQRYEHAVRVLEIDRLAFLAEPLDPSDPWFRQVAAYPTAGMPLKHKILRRMLRYPTASRRALRLYQHAKAALLRHSRAPR